jgi:hypothetical protein
MNLKNPDFHPEIAGKNTHDKINELVPDLLSGLEKNEQGQYTSFLDEYDSIFKKLRNVAEERQVDGLSKAQIEMDPRGKEPKAKIEEAMVVAFGNLPEVFEEFRKSLLIVPGNSFEQNLESLTQLKEALENLLGFFDYHKTKFKTDNAELALAIGKAHAEVQKLNKRVISSIDSMNELLSLSLGY